MSNQPILTDPDETPIEAALGALVPIRSPIDRDRVMFLAGQASARRSIKGHRPWIALAASLALIALGEAALLVHRPPPQVVERQIVVREPAPESPTPEPIAAEQPAAQPLSRPLSLGQTEHERQAALVMRYGLDGLPASPVRVWTGPQPWPATSGRLLHAELLGLLEPGGPS